ncbi:Transcriptional regulator, LysR family protein [Enhygromyxa salina]|uniref:Transcriptional regulator, LysR family protein n=1 Tax=Enhygromyxa salina TaxID=215803 RepID=A0A0C1ZPS6_9BACT|nr:LysR family transcriptional regulator [Enhygromyxa salina]KIG19619.1 Transcriptional regulator, LysR family protein [Enhygromyxa salina]
MEALPSIENLRCFEAAARTENFRAAAKLVALTPAAFGQRIKQLEDQLGAALFLRTTRSVRLTTEGQALLPQARKILVEAGECARIVRGELGTPLSLTVGTRFELGLSWLLPLLPELERVLPQLRANLYFGSGPDLLARLGDGTLDCVVTSARLPDPSFEGEVLFEENYVFVAAASLVEHTPFRRRRDANRHRLLDVDAELPLYRYLRDAPGLRGAMRFESHRYLGVGEAIRRRVIAGEGVAVLPEYMVRADLANGSLVQLLRSVELLRDHFRLVFRSADLRRERFFEFAEALRRWPLA